MRLHAAIVMLFFLAAQAAAASTLKGVVVRDEVGGATVGGVVITSTGANRNVTLRDGQFKLDFPDKKVGDVVHVFVSKGGYVVVNEIQLEQILPANPDATPLLIIICSQDKREEMARRFYRLKSLDTVEEFYQKRLKELEEAKNADARTISDLKAQRAQAQAAATKAADELGKDNWLNASAPYQSAMRLFLNGKSQEAVAVLDEDALTRSVTAARGKEAEAEKIGAEARNAIKQVTQAWVLRGQLFTLQFKFNDAERAYKAAIDASPGDYDTNFAYGLFNQQLNRYTRAEVAYKNCLRIARSGAEKNPAAHQPNIAATLNNLADIYTYQERSEEAVEAYQASLTIYQQLALKDPHTYQPNVALTLFNLQQYDEALKIYRELAQQDPKTYLPYVAVSLNGIGSTNDPVRLFVLGRPETEKMRKARRAYEEALGIYRHLPAKDPETLANEASTLNNLGNLNGQQEGKAAEAQQNFDAALQILRLLAEQNPEGYLLQLAQTLHGVVLLNMWLKQEPKVRQALTEEVGVYERLAQLNPEQFSNKVDSLKLQLSNLKE